MELRRPIEHFEIGKHLYYLNTWVWLWLFEPHGPNSMLCFIVHPILYAPRNGIRASGLRRRTSEICAMRMLHFVWH